MFWRKKNRPAVIEMSNEEYQRLLRSRWPGSIEQFLAYSELEQEQLAIIGDQYVFGAQAEEQASEKDVIQAAVKTALGKLSEHMQPLTSTGEQPRPNGPSFCGRPADKAVE